MSFQNVICPCRGGSDSRPIGRFSCDQPPLLEQLVHQLRHEAPANTVSPVLIADTADRKVFCNVICNRVYDVEIRALCLTLFQDKRYDLITL